MFWSPQPQRQRKHTLRERERAMRVDERWKTTGSHRSVQKKNGQFHLQFMWYGECGVALSRVCARWQATISYIVFVCKLILSNLIKTISKHSLFMRQYIHTHTAALHKMWHKDVRWWEFVATQRAESRNILWQHLFPFMHGKCLHNTHTHKT